MVTIWSFSTVLLLIIKHIQLHLRFIQIFITPTIKNVWDLQYLDFQINLHNTSCRCLY